MDIIKNIFIFLLRLYQLAISPFFGDCCRFTPSCSAYSIEAIRKHGAWKGCYLTLKRLLKCHPWHPGGADFP